MTVPQNGVEPLWTVVSQVETRQQGQNGAFQNGVLVTYQAAGGLTGSVFVADKDYRPEIVKRLIADRVSLHRQIRELQG